MILAPDDVVLPDGWTVHAAADTGSYNSGLIAFISPDKHAFVVEEHPNYQYSGGEIELLGMTVGEWSRSFAERIRYWTKRPKARAWVDQNSQFKSECALHGLYLDSNPIKLEVRTEISREYFQHSAVWLAPWLRVLPYELEEAKWAPQTAGGKNEREKEKDHTLDGLEHILSRRPRTKYHLQREAPKSMLEQLKQLVTPHPVNRGPRYDPHLGRFN